MILIVSHDSIDEPTNDVIDWLQLNNANFQRINGDDFYYDKEFNINYDEAYIETKELKVKSDHVNVIWYRRWINRSVNSIRKQFDRNNLDEEERYFLGAYNAYLMNEVNGLPRGVFNLFRDKKWIPDYGLARGGLNKLETLQLAKSQGVLVPKLIITTSKKEVTAFYKKEGNLITKSIIDADLLSLREEKLDLLTKVISEKEIEELPATFFPTLFQKKIEKAFELRTFFIEEEYYSMAIFSQNDDSTSVDFRNYNSRKPNRYVPFQLPKSEEDKLRKMMKVLGLTTGSIDILVEKGTQKFYFLEVNPVGQLGMVSDNCNYCLEKIIAEKLIHHD